MANENELKQILEALGKLTDRLATLETKTAALTVTTSKALTATECAPGNGNGNGTVKNPTANNDSEYWAAAFQAGLALSQQKGLKGWQTAIAALLPAVTNSVDNVAQKNTSVIAPALVPAALSGAAYYLGRYATK